MKTDKSLESVVFIDKYTQNRKKLQFFTFICSFILKNYVILGITWFLFGFIQPIIG